MQKLIIGVVAISVLIIVAAALMFARQKEKSYELMGNDPESAAEQLRLQMPLESTEELRKEFSEAYTKSRKTDAILRRLYEEWVPKIGANGVVQELNTVDPLCHDEGHTFGRVLYASIQDMSSALRTCEDVCNSGCMHGVLMEAFALTDEHATLDDIIPRAEELCENNDDLTSMYLTGDCYHGTGHALMYLANYEIEKAISACDKFTQYAARYYCATGAYMEYVTQNDLKDEKENRGLFFPCADAAYPAACFRYKMAHVAGRHVSQKKSFSELVRGCSELPENTRIGCFHGLGNGFMAFLAYDKATLKDICQNGTDDDQRACIDGAMERIVKYHPSKAEDVCKGWGGWQKKACKEVIERQIYNMDRDFSLYQR